MAEPRRIQIRRLGALLGLILSVGPAAGGAEPIHPPSTGPVLAAPATTALDDGVVSRSAGPASPVRPDMIDRRVAPPSAWSTLWPSLVVCVLAVLLAMGLRRLQKRPASFGATGPIRVLARHHLSTKQSLCLVQVGQSVVLVGVTPDNMQSLMTVADPDAAAAVVGSAHGARLGSIGRGFDSFVQSEVERYEPLSGRRGGDPAAGSNWDSARRVVRGLAARLGAARADHVG